MRVMDRVVGESLCGIGNYVRTHITIDEKRYEHDVTCAGGT